jgi:L-aminopeptidase/D-esterase-like protein
VITDVPGIRVGHASDAVGLTGVTVVLSDHPAVCGVERRGGANDVVGLDFLDPRHIVETVDAVVLGGGSRFGEESIAGVMRWLEERGIGFPVGPTVVPHVAGAFLFDLNVGNSRARPTREMGYAAARAAGAATDGADAPERRGDAPEGRADPPEGRADAPEGSVGAGIGASVGKLHGRARAMRGGVGSASTRLGEVVVGALVAVNALGDVRDPDTGALIAGTRDAPDGRALVDTASAMLAGHALGRFGAGRRPAAPLLQNTTIGVVATNARLTKPEAATIASLGMLGYARALSPPHTAFDGDTLFALSVGDLRADLTRLGLAAADAVAHAITRAVRAAVSLPDLPAARDLRAPDGGAVG